MRWSTFARCATSSRRAAVAGVLLAATTGTAASAAPGSAPSCNQVKDADGDMARTIGDRYRQGDPSQALDILGGDIAADARTITTVIKVAGPMTADLYSPTGFGYSFRFTVDNSGDSPQSFAMAAQIGRISQLFSLGRYSDGADAGQGVYIRGVVDNARHELRMTADMAQLQALAQGAISHPVGHRLYDFVATSGTSNGDPAGPTVTEYGADVAYGGKHSIKIGAPSCVKPIS